MSSIPELMKKIPEFQRKAEMHDQICIKTLEIVAEILEKINKINEILERNP